MRPPKRTTSTPAPAQSWKLNQAETERAGQTLALLRAVTAADRRKAGVSQRTYRKLVTMFEQQGHCLDRPRSGRPRKYTDDLLEAAIKKLVSHREGFLTAPKLVSMLREEGLIQGKVDIPTFTTHLKAAVKEKGLYLNMRSTSTTFKLLKTDFKARCTYASQMLRHLDKHPQGMLVFADETQLAAAAHPKAQKRVPAHMQISGLMEVPERHHTDKAERSVVNAAVAICQFGGVYVQEVTGTRYPGCPTLKPYKAATGQPMKSMGKEEYIDFLGAAWEHFNQQADFRHNRSEALLVHDRNYVHRSGVVQQWLQRQGISSVVAPPRSPDLMPLDYGIFGGVKQKLGLEYLPTAAWEPRAKKFLQLLRGITCDAAIASFKTRLQACKKARGRHFEASLRSSKQR